MFLPPFMALRNRAAGSVCKTFVSQKCKPGKNMFLPPFSPCQTIRPALCARPSSVFPIFMILLVNYAIPFSYLCSKNSYTTAQQKTSLSIHDLGHINQHSPGVRWKSGIKNCIVPGTIIIYAPGIITAKNFGP